MSTAAAGVMMDSVHFDETSCGPLCQHPQCWASNRRVGRGLPRVASSLSRDESDDEGDLPTLKVHNLLDDYGESNRDRYPSKLQGKDTKMPSHVRSASAPNIMAAYQRSPIAPFTPFASPLGIKGGSVRSTRSAKTTTTRSRSKTTPKISRVEVREMLGSLGDLPPPSAESSSFYIWCPSKKMYKKNVQGKEEIPQSPSKEPVKIQPKDVTDDMVPNMVEKKRQTKTQKSKRNMVHETPTGGRPYTHPTRSPPPVARRTLPQDIDDGITQLLSLPRDVLLEVLEHIKKSDLLDKSKVQLLISQLMPLIHFAPDSPQFPQESSGTPLLDSGILQNHKVTLHDMQEKAFDRQGEFPRETPGNALFLDDAVVSQMASSVVFDENDLPEEAEEQENVALKMEEVEPEIPMTRSTGRMAKAKPLGPIRATQRDTEPVYRLASVSAKSLPPLKPGQRPVKPFNYTNNAATLDLTLVPLPPPKAPSPDRMKAQTPYSAIASTLHVTVPSVPSPDRTLSTTPGLPYGRSPVPPLMAKSKSARSSPSPLPSEEFPELHWYDVDAIEERRLPMHAMSPSMSTKVPKTPLGTPATAQLRQQLLTRETFNPTKVLSDHAEQSLESSSPTPHPPIRTGTDPSEPPLGTIRESALSTYPADDSVTGFNSRSDYVTSPSKQLLASMSPYGFAASLAGQTADGKDPVPVTPAPTSATEDSWPNIDERDFMRSPDKPDLLLSNQQAEHPALVAPPPSPEPRDANPDFDYQMPTDGSKSVPLSLTPLAEEEEETEQKDDAVKKHHGGSTPLAMGDGIKPSDEEEDARKNGTSADTGVMLESDKDIEGDASEDDREGHQTKDTEGAEAGGSQQKQSENTGDVKNEVLTDGGYVSHEGVTPSNNTVPQSDGVTSKNETSQSGDVASQNNDASQKDGKPGDDLAPKDATSQSGDVTSEKNDSLTKDVTSSDVVTSQKDDVAPKASQQSGGADAQSNRVTPKNESSQGAKADISDNAKLETEHKGCIANNEVITEKESSSMEAGSNSANAPKHVSFNNANSNDHSHFQKDGVVNTANDANNQRTSNVAVNERTEIHETDLGVEERKDT